MLHKIKPILIFVCLLIVLVIAIKLAFPKEEPPEIYGDFPLNLKWSYHLPQTVEAISTSSMKGVLIRTRSALYYLDQDSANLNWTFSVKGGSSIATAKVSNGVVYDTDKERVFALDETSGDLIWSHPIRLDTTKLEVSEESLFINNASEYTIAFDRFTGETQWQMPASRGYSMLFVGSTSVFALHNGLTEYDNKTGVILWTKAAPGILAATQSGLILYYVRSLSASASGTDGVYQVVALDMTTHREQWRLNFNGSRIPHLATIKDMVFVSLNPYLYTLDAKTGTIRWESTVNCGLKPVVLGDTVYILEGFTRRLVAINLSTGDVQGYIKTGSDVKIFLDRDTLASSTDSIIFAVGNAIYKYGK